MKRWRKLGRIYVPDGGKPWMVAYASNPVVEEIGSGVVRIYFSSRDQRQRSSVSFVEIDLDNPHVVLKEAEMPVVSPGDPPAFDDAGISIGCIVHAGSRRYLYYMGWHLTEDVPWRNTIGVAISEAPGQSFERVPTPIVPLSDIDPHTISYPWVLYEAGKFRMWYGSATEWGHEKTAMRCVIKYAESSNGIDWNVSGDVAIPAMEPDETILARPCVISEPHRYLMWFSARGATYRIRSAQSLDGHAWSRLSDADGPDVSVDGWDSEMVEYPCVFDHAGRRWMIYNGNGFGRTGFGLAVLEDLRT